MLNIYSKLYVDKGIFISSESHILDPNQDSKVTENNDYIMVKLDYIARGKMVLPDGSVTSSSLGIKSNGVYFSETYSLPVPSGNFFYHYIDTIKEESYLYFHKSNRGRNIDVSYETLGNKVKADLFNIYCYGSAEFSDSTLQIIHPYSKNIKDILVFFSTPNNDVITYTKNIAQKSVTFTSSIGVTIDFLLIAIPE